MTKSLHARNRIKNLEQHIAKTTHNAQQLYQIALYQRGQIGQAAIDAAILKGVSMLSLGFMASVMLVIITLYEVKK